jgi:hypothetical protein
MVVPSHISICCLSSKNGWFRYKRYNKTTDCTIRLVILVITNWRPNLLVLKKKNSISQTGFLLGSRSSYLSPKIWQWRGWLWNNTTFCWDLCLEPYVSNLVSTEKLCHNLRRQIYTINNMKTVWINNTL